ncbi:leucyl aminopeptidase family protein [Acetobacter orleanensis]|uniref:Cytosol aminopeptidase n=1 Tax=Acetobacter orleanensis TaxID=104099 RepID=A0A4Y3TN08_9PROT|nr:leucyl aminopeptidase family protein [Acetobacter orleanensis]KXV62979.1 leucyl aminopeptidase [Acetobacter orleanensis]PCD79313.1 leucyl aminopeptidase [Acetobacter orleanensis]GAN69716.1 leucyl aminopeptidase [Acetobacter orleanensis JCM 7639]GBR23182.1 leucyl aminopeptidase [Acetobacter orleanensis NRIC 0473]GEB82417.1 cytosol aminopeptidase [Acetobacter orleanensis]
MSVREPDCLVVTRSRRKTGEKAVRTVQGVRGADPKALSALVGADGAAFALACGFTGKPGQLVLVPDAHGVPLGLFGLPPLTQRDPYLFGTLAQDLPAGDWQVKMPVESAREDVILGFCLGAYQFSLKSDGKAAGQARPRLVVTEAEQNGLAVETALSIWLARDLINTPANLLGPSELARAARAALLPFGAEVDIIKGTALDKAYPLLAHVGNGSDRGPRVVLARWKGSKAGKSAPLLSLVGKGVCFDSGGYDIKPSSGMLRMKKDMGGAASVLALARLIMTQDLPVRLEVRLGCVENSVSGHAMRPLDVVTSRAGLTVEIGNTDAEGRLVLCDLLSEAGEHAPDLLLDMATLTGAARVALGPDLPALFCNDDAVAQSILAAGVRQADPLWQLPLWQGYAGWLKSPVADLNNISSKPMAGAVTAGLFLERFVNAGQRWAHIDSYAWNDSTRPGRPEGGDSPGIRAIFDAVCRIFETNTDAVS